MIFWPNQPNEKRKPSRIGEKRTQKNGEEQRIQKNEEEWRGTKMGNGELRSNGKEKGVRSKIQNETYVGKYKSLGNKISASIIVRHVGNLNAWANINNNSNYLFYLSYIIY